VSLRLEEKKQVVGLKEGFVVEGGRLPQGSDLMTRRRGVTVVTSGRREKGVLTYQTINKGGGC